MALLLVQPGVQPAGQFALDASVTSIKGGEVMFLDDSGDDDADGFSIPAAKLAVGTNGGATAAPLFLADDGLKGYGVYFGTTVVKTDTGFASGSDAGNRLGPASYAATGQVTLWDKPGLYAITLDATTSTTLSDWSSKAPGTALAVNATGKINHAKAYAGTGAPALTLVQLKKDETLVTTGGSAVNRYKLVVRFNPFGEIEGAA